MSREIQFRAIRLYDKKMIYGNLVIDKHGRKHIVPYVFFDEDGHHLSYDDDTDKPVFIDEGTVGQDTGRVDISKSAIFEFDVLGDTEGYVRGTVVWDEESLAWMIEDPEGNLENLCAYDSEEIEIIGHKFDGVKLVDAK